MTAVRLVLLNGVPGVGKSTLAAAYVAEHPLALDLDVDVVRSLLGAWTADAHRAGLAARRLALAMAGAHLHAGLDVVVPQYVAVHDFVDALASTAAAAGARFHHVVLHTDPASAAQRHAGREASAVREPLDDEGLMAMARRLEAFVARRPEAVLLDATGPTAGTLGRLVAVLA